MIETINKLCGCRNNFSGIRPRTYPGRSSGGNFAPGRSCPRGPENGAATDFTSGTVGESEETNFGDFIEDKGADTRAT